jgi:hypothetical protein
MAAACLQFVSSSDYMLSRSLITDVNYVLGFLHFVVVDDVADVSKVHAASIFRVEVCVLVSFCVYFNILFLKRNSGRGRTE